MASPSNGQDYVGHTELESPAKTKSYSSQSIEEGGAAGRTEAETNNVAYVRWRIERSGSNPEHHC